MITMLKPSSNTNLNFKLDIKHLKSDKGTTCACTLYFPMGEQLHLLGLIEDASVWEEGELTAEGFENL